MKRFIMAASVSLMALASTQATAQVTEEEVANDQTITDQIVTNGMGRNLQRYSPLDQINTDSPKEAVFTAFSCTSIFSVARSLASCDLFFFIMYNLCYHQLA